MSDVKCWDIKAGIKDVYGTTHWRTIGTIFTSPDCEINRGLSGTKKNAKGEPIISPAGFVIDFPNCQGIIVPRQLRKNSGDDGLPGEAGEGDVPV